MSFNFGFLRMLTSFYGKLFDFVIEVVTINIEDDTDVQDEQGDQQIGDV